MIALMGLSIFGLVLAGVAVWIWSLVDVLTGEFQKDNDRVIWVIILLLLPFPGFLLYLMFGRKNRMN